MEWSSDIINRILVGACAVTMILAARKFVLMFPLVWASVLRRKKAEVIFENIHLSGERDLLSAVCILPFCLVTARFALFRPEFFESFSEGEITLLTAGAFIAWILLRGLLYLVIAPGKNMSDEWKLARSLSRNHLVVTTVLLLATAGILTILDVDPESARRVLLWLIALAYLMLLRQKMEIIASRYSHFKAFLYLCALEGVTSSVLIFVTVYL